MGARILIGLVLLGLGGLGLLGLPVFNGLAPVLIGVGAVVLIGFRLAFVMTFGLVAHILRESFRDFKA